MENALYKIPFWQERLDDVSGIMRMYSIGDKQYFFSLFPMIDLQILDSTWQYSQRRVQFRNEISDGQFLSKDEDECALKRLIKFKKRNSNYLDYLKSPFDREKLNLKEEKIERRFRRILAIEYIKQEADLFNQAYSFKDQKAKFHFASYLKPTLFVAVIILLVCSGRIIDGLTPYEKLAEKIYEKSKYKFDGAICNDGSMSQSQGQGTCSHHGGVSYYFYEGQYSKTMQQCRIEARQLSWID